MDKYIIIEKIDGGPFGQLLIGINANGEYGIGCERWFQGRLTLGSINRIKNRLITK